MKKFFSFVLVALALAMTTESAFAQRDAGAKMRGEFGMSGGFAGRSMKAARDTSHDYRQYVQQYVQTVPTQVVSPVVAKAVADSIGDYIEKSQVHMAWMRKQAAGDQETLVSIDLIDKSLAEAGKSHKEMHAMCMKTTIETGGTMKCCEVIDKSLAVAISEHEKLMKRIKDEKPATAKK